MKNLLLIIMGAAISAVSFSTFADTTTVTTITGKPVVLDKKEVYYYPSTYVAPTDSTVSYSYVNVGGVDQVCYPTAQTAYTKSTETTITVDNNGTLGTMYCYTIDPAYFTVAP